MGEDRKARQPASRSPDAAQINAVCRSPAGLGTETHPLFLGPGADPINDNPFAIAFGPRCESPYAHSWTVSRCILKTRCVAGASKHRPRLFLLSCHVDNMA